MSLILCQTAGHATALTSGSLDALESRLTRLPCVAFIAARTDRALNAGVSCFPSSAGSPLNTL